MSLLTLSDGDLLAFTRTLSTRDWRKLTESDYAEIGEFVATDGCSGVPDFYLNCCIIHDFYYRTHRNLNATRITKGTADKRLRDCIMRGSVFRSLSPMAWWRYWGVRGFGKKAWFHNETPNHSPA